MNSQEEVLEVLEGRATVCLVNADCLSIMATMPAASVDLVVTDPPYLIDYKTGWRKDKTHRFTKPIEGDSDPLLIERALEGLFRVMKPTSALYMFLSSAKLAFFVEAVQRHFKLKNTIVWVKNSWTAGDLKGAYGKQYELCIYAVKGHPSIRGKRITDVWNYKRVPPTELIHQNQKPLELIMMAIEKSSDENAVVFDPFAGSGTTLLAANKLNRRGIGIEKDEGYFLKACDRLSLSI